MVGRLAEISPFLAREKNAWLSPDGEGRNHWEELPYWLKGFADLGHVLGDPEVVAEARVWLEGMLVSRQADGWFGPRKNREQNDVWPNMVAVHCLRSHHEATGDPRVLDHLTHYFRWQQAHPDLLPGSWQQIRGGDDLESVHWLYHRTGDAFLLELAARIHERTADWTRGLPSPHGVNICQGFREPAQYHAQSHDPAHLAATYDRYHEVMERYGQVPGGLFGADENSREGHHDPRQGAEACSMTEFMRSAVMLLRLTGDPVWADRCEDVAFNSLPAAFTPDLRALRYLTAPNQVVSDGADKHPIMDNQNCMFAFSPHRYRCCQHNVSHGWPGLAAALWHATPDAGLAATFPVASRVTAHVGHGAAVQVETTTGYPFEENVHFAIHADEATRFPLYLRVPGWCERARVTVNNRRVVTDPTPGRFVRIERTWQRGDTVTLELPMVLRTRTWPQNGDSVSLDRGPLTFSLAIHERWDRFEGQETWPAHERADRTATPDWPAWEVHPTTPWNYALAGNTDSLVRAIRVEERPGSIADQPFTREAAPLRLQVPARRLPSWTLENGVVGCVPRSPVATSAPMETVTLVPMGAARLRVSSFPTCGA